MTITKVPGVALSTPRKDIAVIKMPQQHEPFLTSDIVAILKNQGNPSLAKFLLFWTLMDTVNVHGYIRASMSTIGRSIVGTWWKIKEHGEYKDSSYLENRKTLLSFYEYRERSWDNIRDYQSMAYKFMLLAMYLRYFGQAALHIVRNDLGIPVGLDFLTGLVIPYVDERGYFKSPAFVQYPSRNPLIRAEFDDPLDIVFITNPDWEGSPLGGSDIEALSEYTLPIDLYLQTAAREYMKNRNKPEMIWMLPNDASDEAFDTFVQQLQDRYTGPRNIGKNPIVTKGEIKAQELSEMPAGIPYQESRKGSREEVLAVAGTPGSIIGVTEEMASANIRETRRQFHETTMEPLFTLVEQGLYDQIHVREFDMPGCIIEFNQPDFLNAVERATVDRRRWEIGTLNPNEIRDTMGYAERDDDLGELYRDELNILMREDETGLEEPQGSPPEGREDEPDDPAQVGEPSEDDDPPRGDQHDDEPKEDILLVLDELRVWKRFILGRIRRKRSIKKFDTLYISEKMKERVESELVLAKQNTALIKIIFNEIIDEVSLEMLEED